LEHGQIPPHPLLERLNPEIDLTGGRLTVPTALTDLPSAKQRLAAVSSFGFGGANAHAVLEAPRHQDRPAEPSRPAGLGLPLSARSPAALGALVERYAQRLASASPADAGEAEAAQLCAGAALRRTHHPLRLCPTAADRDGLVRALRSARPAG